MIEEFYKSIRLPQTAVLGKRVFKRLFHENALLSNTDKKSMQNDVDNIVWKYFLKPGTVNISSYIDETREYPEVAVLQVNLKTQQRTGRLAEVIHRAIPYPVILFFVFEQQVAVSVAHKRFSLSEREAIVAEEIYVTAWIPMDSPGDQQRKFLESLVITDLPHTHFFAFYSAVVDRVVALDCARLKGRFDLPAGADNAARRVELLAACRNLESEIVARRAALQKETQFNRKVELNTAIKKLQQQLAKLVEDL